MPTRAVARSVIAAHLSLCVVASASAQATSTIAPSERVFVASKIYQQVTAFFPDLSLETFDRDYSAYLTTILDPSMDRRAFDLASMALIATLHDGHTFFFDDWLGAQSGEPTGLTVYPWGSRWVVVRSRIAAIRPGSVITAVDGVPTEQFFERNRRYISASSDRDATVSLFDTPVLFPERFTLTIDGGREVVIDRQHDQKQADSSDTEGRWLVPGRVGYVRMRSFRGLESQAPALTLLNEFRNAATIVLDLRGNLGGGDPRTLQRSLMDKAYPMWSESSAMQGGAILRGYGVSGPHTTHVTISDTDIRPRGPGFTGRLIILIDRGCTCACEDFVMPFKITHRAQLVGETTAGTFSFTNRTQFANGLILNVAAVRHTFPDGSKFEGVGISPDVVIEPSVEDLRAGRDVVLQRAMLLAGQR